MRLVKHNPGCPGLDNVAEKSGAEELNLRLSGCVRINASVVGIYLLLAIWTTSKGLLQKFNSEHKCQLSKPPFSLSVVKCKTH